MLEALGRKEAELRAITDQLRSATPESIESRIDDIRRFVAAGLDNLREVLRKDTAIARAEILKHTTEITMTPQTKAQKKPF